MKKIIFGLLMLVFSVGAFAQGEITKLGSYTLNGESYNCSLLPESERLYIGVDPIDSKTAQLLLPLSELESFIGFLEDIKFKYLEYDSIRDINNIQELKSAQIKNFNLNSTYEFAFYRYNDWEFDFSSSFDSNWYSIHNGVLYFKISTKLTASDNKYIDDYVSFRFNSVKEIDALINVLDKTKIDNIINEVLNKQNLFN